MEFAYNLHVLRLMKLVFNMTNNKLKVVSLRGWASFTLLLLFVSIASNAKVFDKNNQDQILQVIQEAQTQLLEMRDSDGSWNFPSFLGVHYLSQYYLLKNFMNIRDSKFNEAYFQKLLEKTQLPDGSWYALKDVNLLKGDLSATILNYAALKAMGTSYNNSIMRRARAYILKHGGVEKSNLFCKLIFSLFGNYSWKEIPNIPYMLFSTNLALNDKQFAQWIGPHLMPIAYLRTMKLSKKLGERYNLDELWADGQKWVKFKNETEKNLSSESPRQSDLRFIDKLLTQQQPRGSFGAYTVSTLLSMVAIQHSKDYLPDSKRNELYQQAWEKGFDFVERLYFQSGSSSYKGVLDDGRYWDTALAGIALQDSGMKSIDNFKTADYFLKIQSENGGFAFGQDFEYAPDTDDTAEILIFFHSFWKADIRYEKSVLRAINWLFKMQNTDGGWGAFDRNNTGNWMLRLLTKKFEDSADLFDESSPDVTGHILEALGLFGYRCENSEAICRAIQYLRKTQSSENGGWQARWGINYIYGAGAAVVGLKRVGIKADDIAIQRAARWIESVQNDDGGFGETSGSYDDVSLAGKGVSTPSQTAWALFVLLESGRAKSIAAKKAADYLMHSFKKNKQWVDDSAVGTGHPHLIYMDYPSYPKTFPLSALSRYYWLIKH